MKKGKLIVIEGCDGAGKETHTKLLLSSLIEKGYRVSSCAFPRYKDTVGGKLVAYCLGKPGSPQPDFEFSKLDPYAASLPYAIDRYESKEHLNNLLVNNDYVILDRYFTSNILLQGSKIQDPEDRAKFINFIYKLELEMLSIPKPNKIFYLWVPLSVAKDRIQKRHENGSQLKDKHELDDDFLKDSNERGLSIAGDCGWVVVDNSLNLDEVHLKILNKCLN